MKIERELKFSTTEEHVPSLAELRQALGSSDLELPSMSIRRHLDSYYDDADSSLQRAGWALRKRRTSGASSERTNSTAEDAAASGPASGSASGSVSRTVAALKGAAQLDGALHSRPEIEIELDVHAQPGSDWPAEILAALPPLTDPLRLRALVELRVRRVVVPVVRAGVAVAELSFDEVVCSVPDSGPMTAAGATLEETPHFTFHEVEIEALDDDSDGPADPSSLASLEQVAAAVKELLPLTQSSTSKLERATTLLGPFIEDKFGGP